MKPWLLFFAGLLVATAVLIADEPPPASLDKFYPPTAPAPVYLLKMLELEHALSGTAVNLLQEDIPNAAKHLAALKQRYAENAGLVPEWSHYFDLAAMDELESAMQAGDQDRVMAGFGRVGATCHNCHSDQMARVQFKYHWDDFSQIRTADPVTGQEVDFSQLMQNLALSFSGIGIDLQEGQPDHAARHADDFEKRFVALRETCNACHSTERKYYVDESVQAMISRMGTELQVPAPDPATVQSLISGIGMESCHKCHLVHVPAAAAKMRWLHADKAAHKD